MKTIELTKEQKEHLLDKLDIKIIDSGRFWFNRAWNKFEPLPREDQNFENGFMRGWGSYCKKIVEGIIYSTADNNYEEIFAGSFEELQEFLINQIFEDEEVETFEELIQLNDYYA